MILKRFNMAISRVLFGAVLALIVIGAISSLVPPGPAVKAWAAGPATLGDGDGIPVGTNGGDTRDFQAWALMPFTVPMYALIAIFLLGALVGAGFAYLRYHLFKLNFERLGKVMLILMPLTAILAVAATLALHRYNLLLLSLYLDIPLVGAPLLYVAYERLFAPKVDRKRL